MPGKERTKGISEYMSHVLAIAVAFVILGLVASSLYSYYKNVTLESQRSEARTLSERVGDEILKLYSKYEGSEVEPSEGQNVTLASSTIDTPEGIGGENYNLYLNTSKAYWVDAGLSSSSDLSVVQTKRPMAKVVVEVTGFPGKTYAYNLYNIPINLTGSTSRPDKIKVTYIRENEGGNLTDTIRMERVS